MFASKNPMESDSNPEEPEKKKLSAKEQIKQYGFAGVISWTLWKLSFNVISWLIAAFGYF